MVPAPGILLSLLPGRRYPTDTAIATLTALHRQAKQARDSLWLPTLVHVVKKMASEVASRRCCASLGLVIAALGVHVGLAASFNSHITCPGHNIAILRNIM